MNFIVVELMLKSRDGKKTNVNRIFVIGRKHLGKIIALLDDCWVAYQRTAVGSICEINISCPSLKLWFGIYESLMMCDIH